MTYNTKMKHMKNKNISEKRKERFCKANISGNLTGFSLDIYSSMIHNKLFLQTFLYFQLHLIDFEEYHSSRGGTDSYCIVPLKEQSFLQEQILVFAKF